MHYIVLICTIIACVSALMIIFGTTVFRNKNWNHNSWFQIAGIIALLVDGTFGFGIACTATRVDQWDENVTDRIEIVKTTAMTIVILDGTETHEYTEYKDYLAIDSNTTFYQRHYTNAYGIEFSHKKFFYSNE